MSTRFENAVEISHDPFAEASLAAMRRWMLSVDLMGYLPPFVATELEGRVWTYFWFGIRRIDEFVDQIGFEVLDDEDAFPEELDAIVALRAFLAAVPPAVDGKRRLIEQIRSFAAERDYVALGRPLTARELFEQWYLKACPGAYMVQRMQLSAPEHEVRRIVSLAAAGLQMFDDLTDLHEDLDLGRLWLTQEELDLLGIEDTRTASVLAAGERITQHRTAVCLAYFLALHDAAEELVSPEDQHLLRSFAEGWLRFIEQGHLRIYPPGADKPWDAARRALERWSSETSKTPLLHSLVSLAKALPGRAVDIEACRARLRDLGGCPDCVAPERAIAVIGECTAAGDQQNFDEPAADATALERVLLTRSSRWTAADFERALTAVSGSPTQLREPSLAEVVANSRKLGARTSQNAIAARDMLIARLRGNTTVDREQEEELELRLTRDGSDWVALGIEAVAATARGLRKRIPQPPAGGQARGIRFGARMNSEPGSEPGPGNIPGAEQLGAYVRELGNRASALLKPNRAWP